MRDLHMHSVYSDGKDTAEEMILSAIDLGLDCVGLSEHSHTEGDECSMTYEGTEAYRAEMAELKKKYAGRKTEKKEGSYTTYLFEKGLDKILKKVGEESTEVIIAAKDRDKKETIYEIADLTYHVMVLMVEAGITLDDIHRELASRHVIDHKVKQEKMG